MPDEIAVMVGTDGNIASLYEDGDIIVYVRNGCSCSGYQWHQSRDMHISLTGAPDIKELRKRMREAIIFMGDCRKLLARSVTGVPYFELEKAGFSVWEATGKPDDYLDDLAAQESKSHLEQFDDLQAEIPAPLEVFPGCYRISLMEIQRDNMRFTSKQVLQQFLQQREFRVLEIICNHVPPWLEAGLVTGEYTGSIESCSRNMSKITIVSTQEENKLSR